MKRTLKEKYDYNQSLVLTSAFSRGYCEGVDIYNEYQTFDDDWDKGFTKRLIGYENSSAKAGNVHSKGFMCGVRDAAEERKRRKKK